mgnify:CR=1 FL=1
MSVFGTLMRRELAGYFFSVRGYVIIAGVQFLLTSVGPWIANGAHAFMERAKNV